MLVVLLSNLKYVPLQVLQITGTLLTTGKLLGMGAGKQVDCKSWFLSESAKNLQGFRVILSSLGLGTADKHKPNRLPTEYGNAIQDHKKWALPLVLPFLVPFLCWRRWKGFTCLGDHTCLGKELAECVLLVRTIQLPMPVTTG